MTAETVPSKATGFSRRMSTVNRMQVLPMPGRAGPGRAKVLTVAGPPDVELESLPTASPTTVAPAAIATTAAAASSQRTWDDLGAGAWGARSVVVDMMASSSSARAVRGGGNARD